MGSGGRSIERRSGGTASGVVVVIVDVIIAGTERRGFG
jgi:hypothetical protein